MVKTRYIVTSFPNELWDSHPEKVQQYVRGWVNKYGASPLDNLKICAGIMSTTIALKK